MIRYNYTYTPLLAFFLLVGCKATEKVTETATATVRDSVSFASVDSSFFHHIFDSVSLSIIDTSRIVQYIRVVRDNSYTALSSKDSTATARDSVSVASSTSRHPPNHRLRLSDIPLYLAILFIGYILHYVIGRVLGHRDL